MNRDLIKDPVVFSMPPPEAEDTLFPAPVFDKNGTAHCGQLDITRTVAVSKNMMRISVKITNGGAEDIRLISVPVCRVESPSSIFSEEFPLWRVSRIPRNKNDIPGLFAPSVDDIRLREALYDCLPAGGGITGAELLDDPECAAPSSFYADPAMIFTTANTRKALFFGFDGQEKHLCRICFSTSCDRKSFRSVTASAEMDGALLPHGESLTLQDFIIESGDDVRRLLVRHAGRVAKRLGTMHSPYKNIYCTWYYYDLKISRGELMNNLDFMRKNRLPFDVFQIDSGWFQTYGDWDTDRSKFPGGMDEIAGAVRSAGYVPGIWTAPFVISPKSKLAAKYPEILLKKADGTRCVFRCDGGDCFVLDPFSAPAGDFIHSLYEKFRSWGFTYHKLDFLRAVFINPETRFS